MNKVLTILAILIFQSNIAFANNFYTNNPDCSAVGFSVFVIIWAVYKAFEHYGIFGAIAAAITIGILIYNFPIIIVIIELVCAIIMILLFIFGNISDRYGGY